jgi:hypothetical protein
MPLMGERAVQLAVGIKETSGLAIDEKDSSEAGYRLAHL